MKKYLNHFNFLFLLKTVIMEQLPKLIYERKPCFSSSQIEMLFEMKELFTKPLHIKILKLEFRFKKSSFRLILKAFNAKNENRKVTREKRKKLFFNFSKIKSKCNA